MAQGKLISGLTAQHSSSAAFRKLLRVRLLAAHKQCQQLDAHAESVHKLRVSTRRASAALQLAKDSLPTKRRERANDLLRSLRRTAGLVRDIDIYLSTVQAASTVAEATRAFLTGHLAYARAKHLAKLQTRVVEALPELRKLSSSVPANLTASREPFGDVVATISEKLLKRFEAAMAEAEASLTMEHLHRLRIQGKRLRYSLEVLPDEAHTGTVKLVEQLQEILGQWHDAHGVTQQLAIAKIAASAVNGAAGSPVMKGIATLTRHCARVETAQLAALRRWIKSWRSFAKRQTITATS